MALVSMSSADCITKSATNEKFISEMKELTRVVLSNWQSYCKGQGHEKVQVSTVKQMSCCFRPTGSQKLKKNERTDLKNVRSFV